MTAAVPSARERGLQFLRDGAFSDSVEFLLQAVVEDPSDVNSYLYLGLAYAQQGDFDKCVEILEQAADLAPTSAKVHYNLGVAYHKAHRLTQAKDEYLRALGLDPTYAVAKAALDIVPTAPSGGPAQPIELTDAQPPPSEPGPGPDVNAPQQ